MEIIKLTYRYTPKNDNVVKYELLECMLRLFCDYRLTLPVEQGSLGALLVDIRNKIKKGADRITSESLNSLVYSYADPSLERIVNSGALSYAGPCDTYISTSLVPLHATKYSNQENLVRGEVKKAVQAIHVLSDKYTMSEHPPRLPVLKSYASSAVYSPPYFSLDTNKVYFKIPSKMLYIIEKHSPESLVSDGEEMEEKYKASVKESGDLDW